MQHEPYIDLDEMPKVLKEKDGKSLSNLITPIVKKTWDIPIESQNIFHQTQVEIDDQMTKVKIESYLTSLLERG